MDLLHTNQKNRVTLDIAKALKWQKNISKMATYQIIKMNGPGTMCSPQLMLVHVICSGCTCHMEIG